MAAAAPGPAAFAQKQAMPLKVLTLNIWQNAARVPGGVDKLVHQIERSEAKIVLLQEANDVADLLGPRLKMEVRRAPERALAILSAFPIGETKSFSRSLAAKVSTPAGEIEVIAVHLPAYPYGPYLACFRKQGEGEILAVEENARAKDLREDLRALAAWGSPAGPRILAGDLNSPSHRDWTGAPGAGPCARKLAFPATKLIEGAGFADAFRTRHPDPVAVPGTTWSTVEKWNDEFHQAEPQDRIDFIFYRGLPGPTAVEVFTDAPAAWPSDHAGVTADFSLPGES